MSPVREERIVTVRPKTVRRRANKDVPNAIPQFPGKRAMTDNAPIPRAMAMIASGIAAPGNGSAIVTGPRTIESPK